MKIIWLIGWQLRRAKFGGFRQLTIDQSWFDLGESHTSAMHSNARKNRNSTSISALVGLWGYWLWSVSICTPSVLAQGLADFPEASQDKSAHLYALLDSAQRLSNEDLDGALELSREMLNNAHIVNIKGLHAQALMKMSSLLKAKGIFDSALVYGQKALILAQDLDEPEVESAALTAIGLIKEKQSRLSEALEYFTQAAQINRRLHDSVKLSKNYNNIGIVFGSLKSYRKGIAYLERSLALKAQIKDSVGMAITSSNMGKFYKELGQTDSAMRLIQTSLRLCQQLDLAYGKGMGHLQIGEILLRHKGQPDSALSYFRRSLEIFSKMGSPPMVASAEGAIGEVWLVKGNYPKAISSLESCLRVGQQMDYPDIIREASGFLSQAYAKAGRYQQAYESHVLYKTISDSMSSEEEIAKTARLEAEFQFQQERDSIQFANTLKIRQSQQEARQRSYTLALVSLALLVVLSIAILIARMYWLKQMLNQELRQKNQHLNTMHQEQEGLLHMVSHDLRSPLNQIKSLMELLEIHADNEALRKEYLHLINKSTERGLLLIEDLLLLKKSEAQQQEEWKTISLEELIAPIAAQYRQMAEQKAIMLQLQMPDQPLSLYTQPDYLERILDNLLSNAIKFSKPDTEVRFEVAAKGPEQICFAVTDRGPGIKPDEQYLLFQQFARLSAKPTAGESSTGLGLAIVQKLSNILGGQIEVESIPGKGATFRLVLPLKAEPGSSRADA